MELSFLKNLLMVEHIVMYVTWEEGNSVMRLKNRRGHAHTKYLVQQISTNEYHNLYCKIYRK